MSNNNIHTEEDGTVRLIGELDFVSTPGIYRELENRFTGRCSVPNIDLAGIEHTDSSGLALLLEWQAIAQKLDQHLHISNAPENLLRLAKLCEADKLLDISGRRNGSA